MKLNENAVGFQHIGFPTNDLEKTIAFYEKLGFSIALRTYNKRPTRLLRFYSWEI